MDREEERSEKREGAHVGVGVGGAGTRDARRELRVAQAREEGGEARQQVREERGRPGFVVHYGAGHDVHARAHHVACTHTHALSVLD